MVVDKTQLIGMKTYEYYERKAAELLIKMGHTLHFQNYRSGRSQIDIVTQRKSCLYIVEVKYRSAPISDYQNWVSDRQCQRLLQAGAPLLNKFNCTEIQLLLIAYQAGGSKAEMIQLCVN